MRTTAYELGNTYDDIGFVRKHDYSGLKRVQFSVSDLMQLAYSELCKYTHVDLDMHYELPPTLVHSPSQAPPPKIED